MTSFQEFISFTQWHDRQTWLSDKKCKMACNLYALSSISTLFLWSGSQCGPAPQLTHFVYIELNTIFCIFTFIVSLNQQLLTFKFKWTIQTTSILYICILQVTQSLQAISLLNILLFLLPGKGCIRYIFLSLFTAIESCCAYSSRCLLLQLSSTCFQIISAIVLLA